MCCYIDEFPLHLVLGLQLFIRYPKFSSFCIDDPLQSLIPCKDDQYRHNRCRCSCNDKNQGKVLLLVNQSSNTRCICMWADNIEHPKLFAFKNDRLVNKCGLFLIEDDVFYARVS